MAIVVPVNGEIELLKRALQIAKTAPEDLPQNPIDGNVVLGLLSSDVTLSDSSTLSSMLAAEVSSDDAGYERVILNPADDWSTAKVNTNEAVATATEKLFTLQGTGSEYYVYGYFVFVTNCPDITLPGTANQAAIEAADSEILWVEKFEPQAFTISPTGGQIRIILKLELD